MALLAGIRFGPYEILSPIGAGGMGEIYRARDTRLGREVALKVLPAAVAANQERLDRFEQEARSASALNHPNIVTIYEFGQVDSTYYIAMELVEGSTLRELLAKGPVASRRVVQIAVHVANGLAKAHEAGITHRDLKPENLMISQDGFVKILDFGLAKLDASKTQEVLQEQTVAGPATEPGVLMGTVGYMSPEQARGMPVDFRSDQFSLGSILYEMATGNKAFQRATFADTISAILKEEPPPIGSQNPQFPPPVCWIVERCLAKDAESRFKSTRDLAQELEALRDKLSEAPAERVEVRSGNLPTQRTTFVGREREGAAVKDLLLRDDVRLVTLTGPGGIGKTRLAVQIVGELTDRFPMGVHFIPLAPVVEPERMASTISQMLGVKEVAGQAPLESLKDYLQTLSRCAMLIVLDNFEHLSAAAPMIADLLASSSKLKILVTSRSSLHIYGEFEFPVPPLELPDPKITQSHETLAQYPSVALFVKRAKAVRPDFALTDDNAASVANICLRLDGLPLAIELAAARIKLLSPANIESRLTSRLQFLTGGARDLPERQRTLRGAIDLSYDLLNEAEQMLFRRLAVFVSGCTLEAVEAVCNAKRDLDLDVLDGMASLVDKSLLQQADDANGEARFMMLETIREYGLEKLHTDSDEAITKKAHAAYFMILAEEWALGESESPQMNWFDRYEVENDNFRAALDWLTTTRNAEWGLRLAGSLFRFWESREYLAEGRDRLVKLLSLPGGEARARARAHFAAGVLAGNQRDHSASIANLRESFEIARGLGNKRDMAISLNGMAAYFRDKGDLDTARRQYEESMEMWRELGDRPAEVRAYSNLAGVMASQGELGRARSIYEECYSMFRELGDLPAAAWSLNHQGDVAREQGDPKAARSLYQQSLSLFEDLGDKWGMARSLADMGNLASEQKDFPSAHSHYTESINIFKEFGHKGSIAQVLERFACLAASQGDAVRALRLAGAASALRRSVGTPAQTYEKAEVDCSIQRARQELADSAASKAWLEGWSMAVEKAVQFAIASY